MDGLTYSGDMVKLLATAYRKSSSTYYQHMWCLIDKLTTFINPLWVAEWLQYTRDLQVDLLTANVIEFRYRANWSSMVAALKMDGSREVLLTPPVVLPLGYPYTECPEERMMESWDKAGAAAYAITAFFIAPILEAYPEDADTAASAEHTAPSGNP